MRKRKLLIFTLMGLLLLSTCKTTVYAEEGLVYEVQKGDCLWRIAKKIFGDGARYTDIVAWNEDLIGDPGLIYPGMKLQIILDSYVPSEIDGTTWKSEWLGMQLDLPDSFEFRDMDEYFEEMNISDEEDDLSGDSDGYSIVEFLAVNPSALFSIALMGAEKTDCSIEEYAEKMKSLADAAFGMEYDALYSSDYEWGRKGTEKIGGRSFEHYYAREELKEDYIYFAICVDFYITKKDDKLVVLFTAYVDMDNNGGELLGDYLGEYYADHGIDELLDGFSAY